MKNGINKCDPGEVKHTNVTLVQNTLGNTIMKQFWNIIYRVFREDFLDVTLACEDGQQIGAHKVILLSSSPLERKMGTNNYSTNVTLVKNTLGNTIWNIGNTTWKQSGT